MEHMFADRRGGGKGHSLAPRERASGEEAHRPAGGPRGPVAPPRLAILPPMPRIAAGALVFLASAAVLMLEILAGRLLAPYVGISLETYTGIIGVVLAGISLGAWGGGWLADRVDPRRTLGPILMLGGALALLAVPTVRLLGEAGTDDRTSMVLILTVAGFFPSAAVLSAVTPTVIKLQLRSLEETGRVVGRLSAIGTAGAICGTFVTGFLLI